MRVLCLVILTILLSLHLLSTSDGHGMEGRRGGRSPRSLPATRPPGDHVTAQSPSLSQSEKGSSLLSSSSSLSSNGQYSSAKSKEGRGLSILHTGSSSGSSLMSPDYSASSHSNNHPHHHSFNDASVPSSSSSFDWTKNGHDVPVFVSEALNGPNKVASLLDRAIVRAPWNVLTAKLFRVVAIFFLESYLVQLFGVTLPIA